MTNEIIIDETDVSECKHFENADNEMGCSLTCCGSCRTYNDCYYKQLKRKEQECEEYKKKFSRFFNIDNQECWDIAFLNDEKAKYKQVLDKIEKLCIDHPFCDCSCGQDILDIIDEAKEQ